MPRERILAIRSRSSGRSATAGRLIVLPLERAATSPSRVRWAAMSRSHSPTAAKTFATSLPPGLLVSRPRSSATRVAPASAAHSSSTPRSTTERVTLSSLHRRLRCARRRRVGLRAGKDHGDFRADDREALRRVARRRRSGDRKPLGCLRCRAEAGHGRTSRGRLGHYWATQGRPRHFRGPLHRHEFAGNSPGSGRRGSNPRPSAWEAALYKVGDIHFRFLKRFRVL
jgi:hypothetical protein